MQKLWVVLLLAATATPALGQTFTEQEKNKQVARIFFEEVLGQGRLDKYAESHASNFIAHASDRNATLEEDMAAAREERHAVPDLKMIVNEMVAERDLVTVFWTAWGTNTQPGMGLPATGKKIKTSGMTLFRFKAGKIVEEWSVWDMLSVLQQAGLIPTQP